jgi:hypothetical protein
MSESTRINIIMEQALAEELEQRAEAVYLPVGNYIELILMEQLHGDGECGPAEE